MRDAIVLVTMPWAYVRYPSIALGILSRLLGHAGLTPIVRSYNLAFLDHVARAQAEARLPEPERITIKDYQELANMGGGLGDWVFAVPPFRDIDPERDEAYLAWLAREGASPRRIALARALRAHVPSFITATVEELLGYGPAMVGFTSMFSQNVASLLVAHELKRRAPHVAIVLGGANCEAPMGRALHRAFPCIDVVVEGEAENLIVDLARDVVAGRRPAPRPGLCTRAADGSTLVGEGRPAPVIMDQVPTPDYDYFFEDLERSPFRDGLRTSSVLSIETSRGCWWGEKQHCTFCGLNGSNMAFRSKSPERAFADIVDLATRHRHLRFAAVDNIISLDHVKHVLPRLGQLDADLSIFYETKSNLTKEQLILMREAGITSIQPGIESFSDPILRLMRKGVAGWQNVRLLKWCAQLGIRALWNIIYGFPGEPPEEYARMAALIPALIHLPPPELVRLQVQRYSPYHQSPEAFGITLRGAAAYYRFIYPLDEETLAELAYDFGYAYDDGRDPEAYVAPLREAIERWRIDAKARQSTLVYHRGPGFLRIVDRRQGFGYESYLLENSEAAIYLACDGGATAEAVHRQVVGAGHGDVSLDDVRGFLSQLTEAGLVFAEAGRFVSLALPARPERELVRRERGEYDGIPSPGKPRGTTLPMLP
ncbi:MAG TPA: RiPP maturation radical SAM C-methyltransferase [Polyangia bacterium]|jgi:magnesium-protoporphyrin IX monomethyl ester (oxidative) cyclase|nr:RiPP maturation radical SAM C-methyltransferase [Polyangia bacterium]